MTYATVRVDGYWYVRTTASLWVDPRWLQEQTGMTADEIEEVRKGSPAEAWAKRTSATPPPGNKPTTQEIQTCFDSLPLREAS